MEFDENWWKIFLQASRTSLKPAGPPNTSDNPNFFESKFSEKKYKNLIIKALKCQNSKFDDEPEVTAYLQVKDITIKNKDKVFVFNDWTFASSPTIKPFDHPVYDIWLSKCII